MIEKQPQIRIARCRPRLKGGHLGSVERAHDVGRCVHREPVQRVLGKHHQVHRALVAARLADHVADAARLRRRDPAAVLHHRQLKLHQADDHAAFRFVETTQAAHVSISLSYHRVEESSPGLPDGHAAGPAGQHEDHERQHVGDGVEQVIAPADADRLQRRADGAPAPPKSSAAPMQRRWAPAREDHQRHRYQPLAAGDPFVPATGIEQRQRGAAQAGDEAAGAGRRDAKPRPPSSRAPAWRWPNHPPCAPAARHARAREAPPHEAPRARCRSAGAR